MPPSPPVGGYGASLPLSCSFPPSFPTVAAAMEAAGLLAAMEQYQLQQQQQQQKEEEGSAASSPTAPAPAPASFPSAACGRPDFLYPAYDDTLVNDGGVLLPPLQQQEGGGGGAAGPSKKKRPSITVPPASSPLEAPPVRSPLSRIGVRACVRLEQQSAARPCNIHTYITDQLTN